MVQTLSQTLAPPWKPYSTFGRAGDDVALAIREHCPLGSCQGDGEVCGKKISGLVWFGSVTDIANKAKGGKRQKNIFIQLQRKLAMDSNKRKGANLVVCNERWTVNSSY